MATKDVAVFDGTGWVSISGGDGAPGADGKSVELSPALPSSATNVPNIDDTTPGNATLTYPECWIIGRSKNVYDVAVGVPVGIKGEKGDQGTGVNILGEKPTQGDLLPTETPVTLGLSGGNLWVWDDENNTWINVGSIQGPQGKLEKHLHLHRTLQLPSKVAATTYLADATVAPDGGTTEQPNYKISMEIPKPVRVYKVTDAGDGTPNGITDACTGDFWLVQEAKIMADPQKSKVFDGTNWVDIQPDASAMTLCQVSDVECADAYSRCRSGT